MLAIHFLKQHVCNPPLEKHSFSREENSRATVQLNSAGFSEATQYSRICFTMSNIIAVIKTTSFGLCNLGLIFKFSFKLCVYMPFLAPQAPSILWLVKLINSADSVVSFNTLSSKPLKRMMKFPLPQDWSVPRCTNFLNIEYYTPDWMLQKHYFISCGTECTSDSAIAGDAAF